MVILKKTTLTISATPDPRNDSKVDSCAYKKPVLTTNAVHLIYNKVNSTRYSSYTPASHHTSNESSLFKRATAVPQAAVH